jgi:phosphoglycolate phosphatase-like HAD superfamily hydrolase
MKLVLFDVDGTLIPSNSVEFDYWKAVVKKHFNLDTDRNDIYGEGKTDREILFEHLKDKGIKEPERDNRFIPALKDIGNIVAKSVENTKIQKIRNVEILLKELQKNKSIIIGLLTGNTYEKAKAKLENAGLWSYFKVGAFGDETKVRSDLVKIAMDDTFEKTGVIIKKGDVYLVGDTIRDIKCAKDADVKIIAVATGKESIEHLQKENPDFIFKDFGDIKEVISVINEE